MRDQEGRTLWLRKPAERGPLLKSVEENSALVGTAPAVMSHSSIPAKPQVKIKASARACASSRGSYSKELTRGSGRDVRTRRSRMVRRLPVGIERIQSESGFRACSRVGNCPTQVDWTTKSQGTPAPVATVSAQPIRRMNLAGVPVTIEYCSGRFSPPSETCILVGIPTKTFPLRNTASISGCDPTESMANDSWRIGSKQSGEDPSYCEGFA